MTDPRDRAPVAPLPDRFELGELLGRGAMADVYLAHDRTLDRPVAVKVFRSDPDAVTRQRFQDEARALARLSHPGLVAVYDVDTDDVRPYLVMEPVIGLSLQERMAGGPLRRDEASRMGELLAGALAHAHSRGVVHRDVKPSNILLDDEGTPHLGDFGIALMVGSARLTRTNEIVGTPAYLAPEQVLGDEVGPAVDVYALGLVLLECLTGEIEYSGGSEVEISLARLHRSPHIPPELPPDLARLLGAMTATEPAARPTAIQVANRLGPGSGLLTTQLPIMAPGRRFSRWRLVGVAAAAIAALATGLTLALGNPSPEARNQSPPPVDTQPTATQPPTATTTTTPPPTTPPQTFVRHNDNSGRGPGGPGDHGGGHGGGGGNGGGPGPG